MILAIASAGRAGQLRTFRVWPASWLTRTYLIVPEAERAAYEAAGDIPKGVTVVTHPPTVTRLSPTRDWVTRYFFRRGEPHVVHVDDDLQFHARPGGPKKATRLATVDDLEEAFGWVQQQLVEGVVHVGIERYIWSNQKAWPFVENGSTPLSAFFGANTHALKAWDYAYARLPLLQFLDITLETLRRGYLNRVYTKVTASTPALGNLDGGVSRYRSPVLLQEAVQGLMALHGGATYLTPYMRKCRYANWATDHHLHVRVKWRRLVADCAPTKRWPA